MHYIYTHIFAIYMYVCVYVCMDVFMYVCIDVRSWILASKAVGCAKKQTRSTELKRAPWHRYVVSGMTRFNAAPCMYVCMHVCMCMRC